MDIQDKKDENFTKSKEDDDEPQAEWGKHPNSLKNLKPYPRGISGNTMGSVKKFERLAMALDKIGDEVEDDCYPKEHRGMTMRERVLRRIWQDAIRHGDLKKIQLLAHLGCLDSDKVKE